MTQATRIRSTESERETESWSRNRDRLLAWRRNYALATGIIPDEGARLRQVLAGWPRGHRGGWPRFTAYRLAEVVSLHDRRNVR